MSDSTIAQIHHPRETIGAGSIVTLKSAGGPAMVVQERTSDKAHCAWHYDSGELASCWIPLVCLKVMK